MQWALTKPPSGTLERRLVSQRRLMSCGETPPTVTFSPHPLSNLRAGGNRPATRCCLMPPSTILNPSSTSRRSRRWVPLLGMELATILIQPSPSTPLPFHLAPDRIHTHGTPLKQSSRGPQACHVRDGGSASSVSGKRSLLP